LSAGFDGNNANLQEDLHCCKDFRGVGEKGFSELFELLLMVQGGFDIK